MTLAKIIASSCIWGFQSGLPLGTQLCLQNVACYMFCRRGQAYLFKATGKQGVYESPRLMPSL